MRLTETQIAQFYEQGYLIVENVLSAAEIAAVRTEYSAILDREAPRLVAEGKISQDYAGLPFEERYSRMLKEMDDLYTLYQHLDISLPLTANIPADTQIHCGTAVFHNIVRNEKILDIAESLLGPEIYSNPTQHTRIKPPISALPQDVALDSNVAKTWWHQDEGVLTDDAVDIDMVTVWVAMTDATLENGCLKCVPASHRRGATIHCPGNGFSASELFIPETLIAETAVLPLPVKKGGVVLLHKRTQHAALDNHSDQIRWSFDLRFNVIGQATGRHWFPGFVARSAAHPELELHDAAEWAQLWYDARDRLSQMDEIDFNGRWTPFGEHVLCA